MKNKNGFSMNNSHKFINYLKTIFIFIILFFLYYHLSAEVLFDQDGIPINNTKINQKSFPETKQTPEAYLPYYLPSNLAELNSDKDDLYPCISSDGLTIYFTTNRDGNRDIWIATRVDIKDSFTAVMKLPALSSPSSPVNTDAEENCPSISSNGLTLYFARTTDGTDWNKSDIYYATRTSKYTQFDNAKPLTEVNTSRGESMPCISEDGLKLYFSSNRDKQGDIDIYVATRNNVSEPFSAPTVVSNLTSTDPDLTPYIARDNYSFYFARRPVGGSNDIYIATRTNLSSGMGVPEAVTQVNTDSPESGPSLLYTGQILYFCSNITTSGYGGYDLWYARKKVDAEPHISYFPQIVYLNNEILMICSFRNSGSEKWTSSDYKLGITGDVEKLGSDKEVLLTQDVVSGGYYQFTFKIKPTQEGTYTLNLRMIKTDTEWFGMALEAELKVVKATSVEDNIFELYQS